MVGEETKSSLCDGGIMGPRARPTKTVRAGSELEIKLIDLRYIPYQYSSHFI